MSDNAKGFTFTWEIENFSMLPHRHGEELKSETFVVEQWNNMECYLSFYPKGEKRKEINTYGYLSLFLNTSVRDLESKYTFSFTIVSSDPSSDKTRFVEDKVFDRNWGFPMFMSLDCMYANKQLYFPYDTLTLRCYLKPTDDSQEEVVHSESKYVPNFLKTCNSRTIVQVNRRSITLPLRISIEELEKRSDTVSFVLENALKESAGLKITFHFTKLGNDDFVKIEISQTNLPFGEERLFVKCKMTVISAHKKYQDEKESTHLFRSSLENIWHFPEFIKTSNLTRDQYLYLDDTLLLQCEFAFSRNSSVYNLETSYTPIAFPAKENRSVSKLVTNLEELYLGGKFCDVELRAGDDAFPAHKLVLCAMSPVFRAMFESDLKERDSGVVEIEDVDPDTLRRMLGFLHSDRLKEDLSFESAVKLFSAADKYDIGTLRRRCSLVLASSLSVARVCEVLVLADAHQDDFLLTAAHNFIRSNTSETFYSKYWENFMDLNPKLSGKIMHQMWRK